MIRNEGPHTIVGTWAPSHLATLLVAGPIVILPTVLDQPSVDQTPFDQNVPQSALEFCPIHCPNGRLGQDLGFGRFAFALKLPELLNRNWAAVRAKLGQTSCFPNGPQIWCPIGQ